jgi:hypothetical protein
MPSGKEKIILNYFFSGIVPILQNTARIVIYSDNKCFPANCPLMRLADIKMSGVTNQ